MLEQPKTKKKVCTVTPLYNEESTVTELVKRLHNMAITLDSYEFEFLFVNDGSTDQTLNILIDLRESCPRIKIVDLSRNWGFHNAYNAGLDHADADADAVIFIDGDLQDPPEVIPLMLEKWEKDYNVVYSVKERRNESMIKKLIIKIFYILLGWFSLIKIDHQAGMFSLVDRQVAEELKKCKEKNKFYVGLRAMIGLNQIKIYYEKDARFSGTPKQSFRKLVNYALNAFFSSSYFPIRILTYFGLFTLFLTVIISFFLILSHVADIHIWFISNYQFNVGIALLVLFYSSIMIIFMGIIGEYVARVFEEVRNRPSYVVRKIYS